MHGDIALRLMGAPSRLGVAGCKLRLPQRYESLGPAHVLSHAYSFSATSFVLSWSGEISDTPSFAFVLLRSLDPQFLHLKRTGLRMPDLVRHRNVIGRISTKR